MQNYNIIYRIHILTRNKQVLISETNSTFIYTFVFKKKKKISIEVTAVIYLHATQSEYDKSSRLKWVGSTCICILATKFAQAISAFSFWQYLRYLVHSWRKAIAWRDRLLGSEHIIQNFNPCTCLARMGWGPKTIQSQRCCG